MKLNTLVRVVNELIAKRQPVLITTHEAPDGDCIGSALALALALRQKGLKVSVVNKDPVPETLTFLAGSQEVLLPASLSTEFEVAIIVDCTDLGRLGFELPQGETQLINIDHHVSNTSFGTYNYVNPKASATGEIIYNLLKEIDVEIRPDIATALYTSLVTDSGSFQYENTSPETLRIAAELLENGAETNIIRQYLWENKPLPAIKALQAALNSLTTAADGKLAWVALDMKSIAAIGASNEHLEGLVNYPRSIAGVEVGMFFKEVEPQKIKVSLRSKQYVDVNALAQKFDGGGHRRAAGCTIYAPLEQAVNTMVMAVQEML